MASIVELRDLTDARLEELLEDARERLFNLRFQRATGQLENYARIREARREVTQLQEVMHKRRLAVDTAASHPEIAPALRGKDWTASAHFDYEESGWLVEFVDDNGTLASAKVDLNKVGAKGRRARRSGKAAERVVSYEVAG